MCIIQLIVSQLVHFVSINLWMWWIILKFAVGITCVLYGATIFLQHGFCCLTAFLACMICLLGAFCKQIDGHLLMRQVLRMVVSTYQAASGAGAAAMEELKLQTKEVQFLFFPMLNLSSCDFCLVTHSVIYTSFRSWKGRHQHATFSTNRLFLLAKCTVLNKSS